MSCNARYDALERPPGRVSIPIGFSNELQLAGGEGDPPGNVSVSIPIGFSNELQPPAPLSRVTPQCGFNPYRVFQ